MARPKSTVDAPAADSGKVTKTAAVKDALANLGRSAMPSAIQEYVANKFGLEMSLNHISNIKSGEKPKRKRGRPRKEKPAAAAAPAAPAASVAVKSGNGKMGGIHLEDIEAAKHLVQKVGSSNLHALIDLVAK